MQIPFDFPGRGPAGTVDVATVIMRWRADLDRVECEWVDYHLMCWFATWDGAAAAVFHPNNRVRVLIRHGVTDQGTPAGWDNAPQGE